MSKKIIFRIILFACFISSVGLSYQYEEKWGAQQKEEALLYIPKGQYLEKLVLGYQQIASDFLWFKTISYFGQQVIANRNYPWLGNLLESIVALDPEWTFPFHFAGVVMGIESNLVDQSNRIVKRGIEMHPEVWQFPFYVGFNYYHVKNNSVCGAKYIYQASIIKGSPDYLKPLAIRLSAKGNSRENHILMCTELLKITQDKAIRKLIKERCTLKLQHLDLEQVEEACQ